MGAAAVLELSTDLARFRRGGPFGTPAGLAWMPAPVPVVPRLGFRPVPAAVVMDGVTARTALRRSWSLVRRRRVRPWFLAVAELGMSVADAVRLSA
ncbi:hypothetical protein J7I94_22390 [Streptomyces sp. ISL-12]|uniref:hypothetical protein n=1 Tax=Streptomyces sp. ISL-12 TaxID=2819177 RepID=UPI001BE82B66|nr:hypothetical protein [Streptomyces sp. ISL-12]MBT2413276.1 hypothetical protein [Streptomyces sp. ISL-12]